VHAMVVYGVADIQLFSSLTFGIIWKQMISLMLWILSYQEKRPLYPSNIRPGGP